MSRYYGLRVQKLRDEYGIVKNLSFEEQKPLLTEKEIKEERELGADYSLARIRAHKDALKKHL